MIPPSTRNAWQKNGKSILFLLALCLPLGLQVFFHPGTTADYRIITISLQLMAIITGISCLSPLHLKISAKVQLLIFLWLGWGWVCAMYSPFPIISSLRQIEWTILVLFTGILAAIFQKHLFLVYWAYGMLLAGFILVGLGIIIYWNFLLDPEHYNWVAMMPHFMNIRHFGYFAAAGTILSTIGPAWMTHQRRESPFKAMPIILFGIQTIAFGFLFWSGSRGSMIAVATGLLWLFFFAAKAKKRWLFTLLTTLSGGTGLILASFFAVENMSMGFLNSLSRTMGASILDRLLSGRIILWEIAIQSILPPEGSLLVGSGPDSFRMLPDIYGRAVQPHNVFVQSLLEWGVPGTLLFCLLLLVTYTVCWNQAQIIKKKVFESNYLPLLGAQALWVSYFFLGLIDGVFYHALPLTILAVCAAIIFAFNPLVKQDT